MSLARRPEVGLHAAVDLRAAGAEPDAAAGGQDLRLRHLGHAQHAAVEGAQRILATGGTRDLDMVQTR